MDARVWDERYASSELVWGAPPNAVVVEQVTALEGGRALDLGCGEGRNALWLASRGWEVDALDFSQVGIDKGRTVGSKLARSVRTRINWLRCDVTRLESAPVRGPFDLILMVFLQLKASERRTVVQAAAHRLAPGGTLLVLGHDSTNLTAGHGGPSDPEVLFTPDDIVADLGGELDIAIAERRRRPTAAGDAIDALVAARSPAR
ncbi:MAG: class I SAM-dependent methyltransferase [Mycobacteriaceae bacterium]|nr:class I SAM-dependent methyltransferase [Mycobacteriaceae bacterium]